MRFTTLIFLFVLVASLLPAQTTVYSQFSGTWATTNIWNSEANGSGMSFSTVDDPTVSVVIQTGHDITLPNSGYSVDNLTVEAGSSLKANIGVNRYVQVYGTSVILDGTIGLAGDGFSLDINGPSCTITGSGSVNMSRLQKDCGDPGVAPATDLTISCNLNLGWSSSASILCTGNPSNSIQRTFNVTISPGATVTVAGDISIDATNGTNSSWQDGTFTVNGILDIADDLYVVTSSNPAGGDITYAIGNGGRIIVRSQVLGNTGATGAANANLNIMDGGTLELTGPGAVFTSLSATKNVTTLGASSTMEYSGTSAQTVEDFFTYANVVVSGGGQKNLEGNTTINGTLTLTNGLVQLSTFNLTIGPAGGTTSGSPNSYVKTNSTGVLKQTGAGGQVNYPVGNSNFNPALLTNSGASDVFSMRVLDDVFTNGTSGGLITGNAVDRTWLVDEVAVGGSDLLLDVQWNAAEELSGFSRGNCYVSHYMGSGWNEDTPGGASGGDPYSRSRSGITTLSPFAVASSGSLPIELTQFEAQLHKEIVHLNWSTASETDNDYFAIERSTDGYGFTEIGRVGGAGTVREPRAYTYLDPRPAPGLNYYRLRQVDVDGRFSLGPLRSVWLGMAGQARVFPSPADTYIRIHWAEAGNAGAAAWELFDAAGRLLMNGRAEDSETMTEIPVQHLLPGAYLIRTTSVRQAWSQAFLKG